MDVLGRCFRLSCQREQEARESEEKLDEMATWNLQVRSVEALEQIAEHLSSLLSALRQIESFNILTSRGR